MAADLQTPSRDGRQSAAVLDLDLDYFERGGANTRELRLPTPEVEASPDSLDLVKVVLLGAPAVGKTSIIQQFVWNEFSDEYVPTDRKHTYYPSVIINDQMYEMKISDIPVIPYFPVNSYYEWTDFRFYGLRSATAYVLVFDLCNVDSFQYIRNLRDQMTESRDMRHVPLLVVGNKQDLLQPHTEVMGTAGVTGASDVELRPDIAALVRSHWRCGYAECSARRRWQVLAVFQQLMRAVQHMEAADHVDEDDAGDDSDRGHDISPDSAKCCVL